MKDTFCGDTAALIRNIDALLEMDAAGALVPHGVGGHARGLLEAASVRLAAAPQPAAQAQHPDDAAVEALAESMKRKLAEKRAQGRSGWDTDCTQQRLSDLLRQHVEKGDVLDVANFCAFLFARGERVSAAQAQEQEDALRCAVGNCKFNGEVDKHSPNCANTAAPQPPAQLKAVGTGSWMRDGGMLYRLTDEYRPTNFDEIRVTMAGGSRDIDQLSAQAARLLDMLTIVRPQNFWDWVSQAYRDHESTIYTIYNMEVAYHAGYARARPPAHI